ncbi:winged helix-turn-helix domain-containing tetratricopeptide repeat protein [Psychromarinibacter halotolerans]|uniref:winged helix-turn-helix domain-containing tetratricopeptide repeat protein n=1 Tax=Psychromarinibacter halotolerans TaxID=1775175 RepID=UPI0036D41776
MKIYEFKNGDVILDVSTGALSDRSGEAVDLRPQTRDVLRLLAENPGQTVGKEVFAQEVWGGRQVGSDSLVQCIAEIRAALGDEGRAILQTVPRKGYRLILFETSQDRTQGQTGPFRQLVILGSGLAVVLCVAFVWIAWPKQDPGPEVVAVLPLADLSAAPHKGYLSDAVSEGIITELARFPQFKVIARTSSFQFRDGARDIREIGDVLSADYLVEGSQQFDGDNLRVTIQLIDAHDGHHLYADQFDRGIEDLFLIQDEIVRQVASVLGQAIMDDLPRRAASRDVDSRLRGMQARQIMTQFNHENWTRAMALEQTSLREEPQSPWGYIGVALMLVNGSFQGWTDPEIDALAEAAGLARKALRIAPGNYMSHYTLARVVSAQGDNREALIHYQRAAELNPSDSIVLIAMSEPLIFTGQTDRAIEVLLAAKAVDPLHGDWLRWQLGAAYWQKGDCEKGLEEMKAMTNPPIPSRKSLAALYICLGRLEEARKEMAEFMGARPNHDLTSEIRFAPSTWKPEGMAKRWLSAMADAGMPARQD